MLAPSLATSWTTTHRFILSRSDSAHAAENCLWGAPRIHGELLKLGIEISERTVSRYLRGRPTTRSQPGVHSSRTTSLTRHLSRR